MLTTNELLDLAKEHQGGVTDYRIGKLLGINPSQISGYRNRGIAPSNPVAKRLGELAGIDPLAAVASANWERSSTEEDREIWEAMLTRIAPAAKRKKAD